MSETFDPTDDDYEQPASAPTRDPQSKQVANDLLDQLDEDFPDGWKPDQGDKIVGVVTQRTMSSAGQYGSYPIIVLQQPDGSKLAVHAFHTVLRNEIERLAVMDGDSLGIKYEGVKQGDVQEYESYRVALQRSSGNAAMLRRLQAQKAV